jgi:hypothetical protein
MDFDEERNENPFGDFVIPENLLERLYDFSGDADSSKGFVLAYASQSGNPIVYTKTTSRLIEMGLRKALEQYLSQAEQHDIDTSIGTSEE